MRPSKCKTFKRDTVRAYSNDLVSLEPRKSLRQILDCALTGQPADLSVRMHQPVEPDGDDLEDFQSGTRELLDLVDVQQLSEEVTEYQTNQEKARQSELDAQKAKDFEDAVNAEIARRQSESSVL